MLKPKKFNIADTNIANLGSELEKNVRESAAATEKAWEGCGQAPGMKIWRINKFKVEEWEKDDFGVFFKGDSYIVLKTTKQNEKLVHDIHFWLGEDTTQDEAGTAAYKTVELDDFLNQDPVEHREVCNYESKLFLSYFDRFEILNGGVESGFRHVKPEEYKPRLLHVKGKSKIAVREVPTTAASLNDGDVFLLDLGMTIYQFNGKDSRGLERISGGQIARAIDDDERSGKAQVIVLDQSGPEDKDKTDFKAFYDALGGYVDPKSKSEVASDEVWDAARKHVKSLFKVSDESGKMSFTKEAEGNDVKMELLDSDDVFILDAGPEIFIWCGTNASADEKKHALGITLDYMKDNGRPLVLPTTVVREGGENEVFKTYMKLES